MSPRAANLLRWGVAAIGPRCLVVAVTLLAGACGRIGYDAIDAGDDVATDAPVDVAVDGAVDAPDTVGKMLGVEGFKHFRERSGMEHDGLLLPARIADTHLHFTQRHRSAWAHEIDMCSFTNLA